MVSFSIRTLLRGVAVDVAKLQQSKIYLHQFLVFTGSAFCNILPSVAQVAAFEQLRILQGQVYGHLDCELNVTMSVRSKTA